MSCSNSVEAQVCTVHLPGPFGRVYGARAAGLVSSAALHVLGACQVDEHQAALGGLHGLRKQGGGAGAV